MKKVGVVILNYKTAKETLACIKSVNDSEFKNIQIIVVDNNSKDGVEDDIKQYKEIIFVQAGSNLGYSGGNNIGIKKALNEGCDYIFIINADTTIVREAVSKLVESMGKDENIGIIGPKILFGKERLIWYAGGYFDRQNVLGGHRGVNEKDHGQYDVEEETQNVSGGAMFVNAKVFKEIGFFDEKYFLYYEDSDYCLRAKRADFKLVYAPSAVVFHENAKSTGLGSHLQDYFITRNRMLLASKFLPLRTRFALFREGLRNIGNPIRRLAFWDYLTGNFGKGSYLK